MSLDNVLPMSLEYSVTYVPERFRRPFSMGLGSAGREYRVGVGSLLFSHSPGRIGSALGLSEGRGLSGVAGRDLVRAKVSLEGHDPGASCFDLLSRVGARARISSDLHSIVAGGIPVPREYMGATHPLREVVDPD